MKDTLTVFFPITDLARDGAQRQLFELVKGLDKKRYKPIVVTLLPGGAMEPEFKEIPEVQVISLKRNGKYDLIYLVRVIQLLNKMKADVVQPFLTPATFFGLLPALLCRVPVKIATERLAKGRSTERLGFRFYLKMEDFLSRFADLVVSNSDAGRQYVIERGIPRDQTKVIYNGINVNRLSAAEKDIEQVRRQLKVPPGGKVVGIMARLFPQKDHATFLRAAAIINRTMPDTRFAVVGDGPLRRNLEKQSQELGLAAKTVFFGQQENVGAYLSAFDIAVLTSEAEGCSNSLLEAMALGKPVVVTDVGGNQELVQHGETGLLVPFGNAEATAEAILSLICDSQVAEAMGKKAREKIVNQFSLEKMVKQYASLYEDTLRRKDR
jgi:glycosyltransferase involved in cell wall biosynthesis